MKRKIISLLLCLVMALSLIPTVAFAKGEGPKPGGGTTYNHIDIRVDGTLTIDSKVNGESQTGYPMTINVTTSNVSGTVNGNSVTFSKKTGQGKENEWRANNLRLTTSDTITIKCTITGTIDGSTRNWEFEKTYTKTELEAAVRECPDNSGFDINIKATELMEQFTKTVGFFTANKEQGLLNTDKESVIHSGLLVDSTFPAVPTLNPADGYEFDGWYEANANGGKIGTEKVTTFPETVSENAYYVAVWKAKAPTTGPLTITKVLAGDGASAAANKEFTFKVMLDDQQVGDPVTITGAGTSTVNGLTVGNTYTVVEVEEDAAIDGYKLTTTGTGDVNVTANGATVTVTNTYEKEIGTPVNNTATLTITKVDSEDNTTPLSGAVFTLTKYADDNTTVIKELTSTYDAEKKLYTITGIDAEGDWTLTETKAPEGYRKTSQSWKIKVIANTSEDLTDGKYVTTTTYKISAVDEIELAPAVQEYAMEIENIKIPDTVVPIPITKTVTISKGSKDPVATPFTFEAYVGNQKVGELKLTPKSADKWTATDNLTVSIPYNLFDDGVATVTIKEVKGTDTRWTYDTKVYTVDVFSNDDAITTRIKLGDDPVNSITFENTYSYKYTPTPRPTTPAKPVTSVQTGDMGVALYAGLAILSMTGSAGVILRRRKNDK